MLQGYVSPQRRNLLCPEGTTPLLLRLVKAIGAFKTAWKETAPLPAFTDAMESDTEMGEGCIAQQPPANPDQDALTRQPLVHLNVVVGRDGDDVIVQRVSAYDELTLADKVVEAMVRSGRIWEFLPFIPAKSCDKDGLFDGNCPDGRNRMCGKAGEGGRFGGRDCAVGNTGAGGRGGAGAAFFPRKTPFTSYIKRWFLTYKTGLAKTTENFYLTKVRLLIEEFGDRYIEGITAEDVQLFLAKRSAQCTKKTVHDDLATLRDLMNSAVEDGLIVKNPTKDRRIRVNAPSTRGTTALTRDQMSDIRRRIPFVGDPIARCFVALLAYTSMRREEVLGLKWECVDFEKGVLRIENAVVYTGGHMYIKGCKTETSAREFPLCSALRDILLACRRDSGYVIYADDPEKPISSLCRYQRFWRELSEEIELYGATARTFRTTFATLAIHSGVDVKTAQGLMGHASSKMTMDVYAKVDPGKYADAIEKLEGYLAA